MVLHQQNNAAGDTDIPTQAFKIDLGTNDGFDTFSPTFFVKLDRSEEVVQVGDGQRGLCVFGCHLDHIVDAASGVNDREFGVKAQVNEHSLTL